jgi:hypothetical protein
MKNVLLGHGRSRSWQKRSGCRISGRAEATSSLWRQRNLSGSPTDSGSCWKSTGSPPEAQKKSRSRSRMFRPKEWHPKVPLQTCHLVTKTYHPTCSRSLAFNFVISSHSFNLLSHHHLPPSFIFHHSDSFTKHLLQRKWLQNRFTQNFTIQRPSSKSTIKFNRHHSHLMNLAVNERRS